MVSRRGRHQLPFSFHFLWVIGREGGRRRGFENIIIKSSDSGYVVVGGDKRNLEKKTVLMDGIRSWAVFTTLL